MIVVTMPCSHVPKLGQKVQIIEKYRTLFSYKKNFSINKGYVRNYHNRLFRNWRRQAFFVKTIDYTIKSSSHVLPWLSCPYLAMILP